MYKIDWNKYLSNTRLRESVKEAERAEHPDNSTDKRMPFESDFGRVVFSSAARRMHDKTQVFPLNTDDNIHTRLTHSIEVMNIGYSIGVSLTRNKDFIEAYNDEHDALAWEICSILKTACFIHDIGNPPFGHFGEDAIKTYFRRAIENSHISVNNDIELTNGIIIRNLTREQASNYVAFVNSDEKYDFTQFDGNAEGFRLITKLQYLDDLYGLNLTCATLAAYLKYPNSGRKEKCTNNIAKSKHGIFYSENEYLEKIVDECNLRTDDGNVKRHPLSYLVEAADSICYLSMDIEDSINKGWTSLEDLNHIKNDTIKDILSHIKVENEEGKEIPSKKRVVDFRVAMIDYFVKLAIDNFISHLEEIDKGTYNNELIRDDEKKVAEDLSIFCKKSIFQNREIVKLELAGDSIIKSLLDHYMYLLFHEEKDYINRARTTIPSSIVNTAIREYKNEELYTTQELNEFNLQGLPVEYRFRIIRDFVASMTDKYALTLNKELNGQRY